jgi:uncharacterized membrane protein
VKRRFEKMGKLKHAYRSILLMLGFILSLPMLASAIEIKFTASGPKQIGNGEQFQVTYTLNTNGSGLVSPTFPDFDLLGGPSQSTNMSIVNGAMSQSVSFTYYLRAKKEGTFTIKPAKIKVNGVEIESNSLNITVTKADPAAAQRRQQQQRQQMFDPFADPFGFPEDNSANQPQEKIKANGQDIFVRVNVDKKKVYQGEPIIATLKIYSRVDLVGFQDIKFPAFTGFWNEEIQTNSQIDLKPEVIDGVQYQVGTFKQMVLTPQKSGSISIDPFEVDAVVRQRAQRRGRSLFDQFFGSYENVAVKLKSQTMKIEVIPYPGTKPADFSGISGKLKMAVSLDKTSTKSNEAVNLKLTIGGSGNLKLLEAPALSFPPDIEAYDPKTSDKISVNQAGISGSRTFEYLLIPRYAGDFKLGPFSISYFDLEKKAYVTLTQPEISLHVDKGEGQAEGPAVSGTTNKEDLKIIGQDIRFIKTKQPTFKQHGEYFFGSPIHLLGLLLPAALFVLFFIWLNIRRKKNADQGYVKNSRATKLAKKRLAKAEKLLKQNNTNAFYDEIARGLWGYVGDKLLIEVSSLTKDNVKDKLLQRGTSEALIDRFLKVLNDAEFARYAPSAAGISPEQVLNESVKIIVDLEA